ncbi:MAG: hypothetical protein Q9191_006796 [Dirinaria sp. TL-2023a]
MDFYVVPAKRERRRIFAWDPKFSQRARRANLAEDIKLAPEAHQTTVDAFFAEFASRLDPPQYSYMALRRFLSQADEKDLQQPSATSLDSQGSVLLDDRRDSTGWLGTDGETYSARDWEGYSRYPPEGENPVTLLLDIQGLYKRQPISDFGFALEFHLPYYALRHGVSRRFDLRGLRRSYKFRSGLVDENLHEYLYEAQVSLLVTGSDEWFWTAYCCAETYFGSEESAKYYHEKRLDAPSGGEISSRLPVWNPREYFLSILSRRLKQVTKEWNNTVKAVEQCLKAYPNQGVYNND